MDAVIKDEMLFTDVKIFGDNEEHTYDVYCEDGHAVGIAQDGLPQVIYLTYPKLDELTEGGKERCLQYRGLFDEPIENCNYSDVCMLFGTISVKK